MQQNLCFLLLKSILDTAYGKNVAEMQNAKLKLKIEN